MRFIFIKQGKKMKKNFRFNQLTLTFIVGISTGMNAYAGAWPIVPGHGSATVGLSFLNSKSVSDEEGKSHDYAVREIGLSTFGQTGVLPRLSLNWSWGLLKSVTSDSLDKAGVTDPELGVTYFLGHLKPMYFSIFINSRIPLGSENTDRVPNFVYPIFSQQEWAFDIKPLIGWSQWGWWFQGSTGPRLRSGDLSAQWTYNIAGGKKMGQAFSGMLALSGILPIDKKTNASPSDQEQYFGFQIAVGYLIKQHWTTGLQMDGMATPGQGMPLAGRFNLFETYAW